MNQKSKNTKSNRNLRINNPVLLIEIEPIPKCCLDGNDYGIFVLTGKKDQNGQFTVDLSTLATIDINSDSDVSEVPYSLRLDIKERLMLACQENDYYEDVPLQLFIEQCNAVFCELMNVLIRERAQATPEQEEWSLHQLRDLQQQLDDLESKFGQTAIQLLSLDLNLLRLHHMDSAGRSHWLELNLKAFPSITTTRTVWGHWEPEQAQHLLSVCSIFQQFIDVVKYHQRAYKELEEVDSRCHILEQSDDHKAVAFERCIQIPDNTTTMILTLDPFTCSPKSIQFMGGQSRTMEELFKNYNWSNDVSVVDNLEKAFTTKMSPLTKTVLEQYSDTGIDCAICYCRELVMETSTEFPTEPCETEACGRFYHVSCLREWLQSLPTVRISFDRVIGACPYCQEPISVGLLS